MFSFIYSVTIKWSLCMWMNGIFLQRKTQHKCYEIAEKNPATINMLWDSRKKNSTTTFWRLSCFSVRCRKTPKNPNTNKNGYTSYKLKSFTHKLFRLVNTIASFPAREFTISASKVHISFVLPTLLLFLKVCNRRNFAFSMFTEMT